jgi:hypothetical protein
MTTQNERLEALRRRWKKRRRWLISTKLADLMMIIKMAMIPPLGTWVLTSAP